MPCFEPAAEDGVPQTPVAGPALVMHPAIDDRLEPRSPLRTWDYRLGTVQRRQTREERPARLVAEATAQLPHVAEYPITQCGQQQAPHSLPSGGITNEYAGEHACRLDLPPGRCPLTRQIEAGITLPS
jgi:hypothetical protein